MSRLTELDDTTFVAEVEGGTGLVAVDFGAAWCGPCRVFTPVVERLAAEYGERLKIFDMDVDVSPKTAVRFGVRTIPTVLFFRDGALVDRSTGAIPREAFRKIIESNLAAAQSNQAAG
jgi:thioredoxin 1